MDVSTDDSVSAAVPESHSSVGARFQPGDVLELSYRLGKPFMKDQFCSYALYFGSGRVIHAWSSSRTHFRVRVDTLRSLETTGIVARDATSEFDAYCANVLDAFPLARDRVVLRAHKALHCAANGRRSNMTLIVHARYGDIAMTMAQSLLSMAPDVVRYSIASERFRAGAISLRTALQTHLHFIVGQYPWPPVVSVVNIDPDAADPAATVAFSIEEVMKEKAVALRSIQSLLASDVEELLAAWLLQSFGTRTSQIEVARVAVEHETSWGWAILSFGRVTKRFTVFLTADRKAIDRLVRERMECGICFADLNSARARLFQCTHVTCADCLASLVWRACPYCRSSITVVREVTNSMKQIANDRIRELELEQLAANDVDAPPPLAPSTEAVAPGGAGVKTVANTPPGLLEKQVESFVVTTMLAEDFDALVV